LSEPGGARAVSRFAVRWAAKAADLGQRLEQRRFTGFLMRSYRRFKDIEGKHLALVIGTNLFVALIPLIIVGYAFIERFNPHRTVGVVLVDAFHLTGHTAAIVKAAFPNAKAGRNIALSISVISLLVTGFDISATVQLAYARAFGMTPLKGAAKYARGAAWLVLLLATTGISLTLRYTVATRPPLFLIVAVPAWLAIQYGFFIVTPRLLLELPFAWRDLATGAAICTGAMVAVNALASFELHRWFSEYGQAYGGFGVGLALMAAVALIATFWVWIAAVMGIYWERKAGSAVVARMEELSAGRARA
jgi:hypothetical protein